MNSDDLGVHNRVMIAPDPGSKFTEFTDNDHLTLSNVKYMTIFVGDKYLTINALFNYNSI